MPDSLPDWARTQREWLRPTVVGRLGIHPPWCDPVGDVPVSIDPGPTFGHGAHPTTTLVLAEVDRLAGPGMSMLDVGCGSGVLAIAAARLGAEPVVGIDVEADAVAWTRTNAAANAVDVSASTTPITAVPGTFDNHHFDRHSCFLQSITQQVALPDRHGRVPISMHDQKRRIVL